MGAIGTHRPLDESHSISIWWSDSYFARPDSLVTDDTDSVQADNVFSIERNGLENDEVLLFGRRNPVGNIKETDHS